VQGINSKNDFLSANKVNSTTSSGDVYTDIFNDMGSEGGNPLSVLLLAAISVQNNELNIQSSASGMLEIMSKDAAISTANGESALKTAAQAVQTAADSGDNNKVSSASTQYNLVSTETQQANTDDSNVINGQSTLLSNLSQTEGQATIPTTAVTDALSGFLSLLASAI
jgi:hypothetical protein